MPEKIGKSVLGFGKPKQPKERPVLVDLEPQSKAPPMTQPRGMTDAQYQRYLKSYKKYLRQNVYSGSFAPPKDKEVK